MELCQARRGDFVDMQFLTEARTTLIYNLPLAEVTLVDTIAPCSVINDTCGTSAALLMIKACRVLRRLCSTISDVPQSMPSTA